MDVRGLRFKRGLRNGNDLKGKSMMKKEKDIMRTKKVKGAEPALATVILSGKDRGANEHEAILDAVMAGRISKQGLILVFRGVGVLEASVACEMVDRLQELRAAGKKVVVVAESWLGASDLLVWLQGGLRYLTASGFGHIKVPSFSKYAAPVVKKKPSGRLGAYVSESEEEYQESREKERELSNAKSSQHPGCYAYEQMLDRLNEFLPVKDYANKIVPRAALVEMGWVTGEGLDLALPDNTSSESCVEVGEEGGRWGGRLFKKDATVLLSPAETKAGLRKIPGKDQATSRTEPTKQKTNNQKENEI